MVKHTDLIVFKRASHNINQKRRRKADWQTWEEDTKIPTSIDKTIRDEDVKHRMEAKIKKGRKRTRLVAS